MNWSNSFNLILLSIHLSIALVSNVVGDEEENQPRCKFQEYRCSEGVACLLTEKLCNGVRDCPSGEDESWDCSKMVLNTDCGDQNKFFKCRFGGCVARKLVCNGIVDCKGGSDEASDLCGNSGLKPLVGVSKSRFTTTTRVPTNKHPSTTPTPSRPRTRPTPRPQSQESIEDTEFPEPTVGKPPKTCESMEEEEGVKIKCHIRNKEVKCQSPVLNGTIATYECKNHFSVAQNSPRTTRRMCKNGSWTKRNHKWHCIPECGKGGRQSAQFIVGGTTSEIGKWPWHVGLYHQDPPNSGKWVYFCGGTLISSRSVLTAAHCVSGRDGRLKKDIRLFFGKYYRTMKKDDEHVQERQPLEIQVNPYYNSQTFASDIANILVKPLEITDRVQIACLPNDGDLDTGDVGTLVGWGRYSDNRYPDELQEANLPVKSFKECQKAHPSLEALVKAESFCAGYRNGTSPCDGDSGGGLVFLDNTNKWAIYGIVSAGVAKRGGGCDPRYYTVFTRVVKFRDFIDDSLDQNLKRRRRRRRSLGIRDSNQSVN